MTELPNGWVSSTIGEVSNLVRGVSFKKHEARSDAASGFLPVVRAGNVQEGRLNTERDLVWVPKERVSAVQRVRRGDIVVATSSGSLSVVGKSAQLRGDWDGAHGAS